MELYIIFFIPTIGFSIGAEFEHEAFLFEACSNKEEEFLLAYDDEELWHIDFNKKKGINTSPSFAGHMTFPGFYEFGIENMKICKSNLLSFIKGFKSPPPQLDAPQTSVYPKENVDLGVQNTLVCHVSGFYPPALSISWAKNNDNVTEGVSLSQYRPMTDGTFNIFSTLKFTPSKGDIYSCTVNHEALQGQLQTKIWDVDVALPSVGPAVFCGVSVILGLSGMAVGTFFLVKGNN